MRTHRLCYLYFLKKINLGTFWIYYICVIKIHIFKQSGNYLADSVIADLFPLFFISLFSLLFLFFLKFICNDAASVTKLPLLTEFGNVDQWKSNISILYRFPNWSYCTNIFHIIGTFTSNIIDQIFLITIQWSIVFQPVISVFAYSWISVEIIIKLK